MFRPRLSAYKVSQLSFVFFWFKFEIFEVDESQYEPLLVNEVFPSIALPEVSYVPALLFVKCTLPLTRRTDNFVLIMASNHKSIAMLFTPFITALSKSHGCTWIESCVVVFAVLRLSRRFCVTLGRAQLFWQTVGACDHVTFELGFSHIGGVKTLKRISENLANVRGKNDILQLSFEFFGSNSRYFQVD